MLVNALTGWLSTMSLFEMKISRRLHQEANVSLRFSPRLPAATGAVLIGSLPPVADLTSAAQLQRLSKPLLCWVQVVVLLAARMLQHLQLLQHRKAAPQACRLPAASQSLLLGVTAAPLRPALSCLT